MVAVRIMNGMIAVLVFLGMMARRVLFFVISVNVVGWMIHMWIAMRMIARDVVCGMISGWIVGRVIHMWIDLRVITVLVLRCIIKIWVFLLNRACLQCFCCGFGGIVGKSGILHFPVAKQVGYILISDLANVFYLDVVLYWVVDSEANPRWSGEREITLRRYHRNTDCFLG